MFRKFIKTIKNAMFPNSLSVGDAIVYEGHEGEIMEMYEETDEFEAMVLIKTEVPLSKLTKLKNN